MDVAGRAESGQFPISSTLRRQIHRGRIGGICHTHPVA